MANRSPTRHEDLTIMVAMIRSMEPPPTINEMLEATGAKSTCTVRYRLDWLEANGYITRKKKRERALAITDKAWPTLPELVVKRGP